MRRRLYFVLPDLVSARQTLNDLLLARIEVGHMHFMAKPGVPMEGLPEASMMQTSDIVHGAESGLLIGGAAGVAAGVMVVLFPPTGLALEFVTVLLTAIFGAAFGAWMSSMVASSIPNTRLKTFERELDAGRILLMVDVPVSRVQDVRNLLGQRHPEAAARGQEPTIPAFP